MKKKIKVLIIQRIFAEYRKFIYDEIIKFIDLKVLHSTGNVGIPETLTTYSRKIGQLKYSHKETNTFLWAFNSILKYKPDVIIHEFAIGISSLPFTLLLAKLSGIKFILWSHGYDRKKGFYPERSISDKYRLWLMKRSDALILYGQFDKQLLSKYVSQHKIFVAQNTIDVNMHIRVKEKLLEEGKIKVKLRKKFFHKFNLIFIGRLLKDKKPEILIQLYELLIQKQYDIGIHFVGEGEELESLQSKVILKGYKNDILFHGSVHDEISSGELLFCSDLMVMPGYLGLSINHAFCYDCPVVSFKQNENGPFHSPEIEYVLDGETGFLIENHSVERMVEKIDNYFNDNSLQSTIKTNIRELLKNVCSNYNMAKGILDATNYSLK